MRCVPIYYISTVSTACLYWFLGGVEISVYVNVPSNATQAANTQSAQAHVHVQVDITNAPAVR